MRIIPAVIILLLGTVQTFLFSVKGVLYAWKGGDGNISFYFSPKWWSVDGRGFVLVYTRNDHWATIEGTFLLTSE